MTGTWTPTQRFDGWVQVMVHVPDHGARSQQAHYQIHTGTDVRQRYLPTRRMQHSWITLGTYEFSSSGPQRVELSNITEDGRGLDNVAWDALAFVPLPAKPAHFVVAMGDSYTSGEGAGGYYVESDNNFGAHRWNACRRSPQAWPRQLVLPGSSQSIGQRLASHDPSIDFQFVACSGARIPNIRGTRSTGYWQNPPANYQSFIDQANGQFGEIGQVDSGVLSDDTTLVLLSAGGNDAGFADVLAECAETSCASSQREQELRADILAVQPALRALIDDIAAKAPNATIVLAGYPMLFSEDIYSGPLPVGDCVLVYGMAEAAMLNSLAHDMRDAQRMTVLDAEQDGVNVQFVDLVSRFGNRGACPAVPSNEDIHAVVQAPTGGGDFRLLDEAHNACITVAIFGFCVSRESFHPKQSGASHYAGAVAARLDCGQSCVGSLPPGEIALASPR